MCILLLVGMAHAFGLVIYVHCVSPEIEELRKVAKHSLKFNDLYIWLFLKTVMHFALLATAPLYHTHWAHHGLCEGLTVFAAVFSSVIAPVS